MNATTPTSATALIFKETEFDIVDLHGKPWLRLPQIEGALGYAHGGRAVSTLFERNADEFTPEMTQILDLPTAGGTQSTRIFSLRGAHLLGMLARTEPAAAFRRWVLDVLEGREAPQQTGPMTYAQRLAYLKERIRLVSALSVARSQAEAEELHENLRQVSRLVGINPRPLVQLAVALGQQALPGMAAAGAAS